MKKINLFAVFVLIALFAIAPAFTAMAREDESGDDRGRPTTTIKVDDDEEGDNDSDDDSDKDMRKGTSTKSDDSKDDSDEDENNNNDKNDESQGEDNRSEVTNAVKKLLEVADRQGGIGAEVREIAHEQNESEATTTKAVKKVGERGSFKTFLIGSDYKNIGAIRSELVSTEKRIARLQVATDKLPAGADKDELEEQIDALKDSQADLNKFIKDNEDDFSLFGWMVRLFAE